MFYNFEKKTSSNENRCFTILVLDQKGEKKFVSLQFDEFWFLTQKMKKFQFRQFEKLVGTSREVLFLCHLSLTREEKKPFYRLAFYFLQLTLRELEAEKEMKPSLSAHIHRDGGIHIALTEKVSNKCDQVTFPAPNK